jgi:UDP-N-acetylglucosamine:LPS N-acetylglucosamine transferase
MHSVAHTARAASGPPDADRAAPHVLDAERLAALVAELMLAPRLLEEMARSARELARPDAAGVLADAVLALANGDRAR